MPQNSTHRQELERKRQYWREHINTWQNSGLSQTEYCRRHELTYHQFVYWREKFAPKPATAISIVEVPLPGVGYGVRHNCCPSALRVSLGQDIGIDVLPGFDAHTLQQIVIVLRGLR